MKQKQKPWSTMTLSIVLLVTSVFGFACQSTEMSDFDSRSAGLGKDCSGSGQIPWREINVRRFIETTGSACDCPKIMAEVSTNHNGFTFHVFRRQISISIFVCADNQNGVVLRMPESVTLSVFGRTPTILEVNIVNVGLNDHNCKDVLYQSQNPHERRSESTAASRALDLGNTARSMSTTRLIYPSPYTTAKLFFGVSAGELESNPVEREITLVPKP